SPSLGGRMMGGRDARAPAWRLLLLVVAIVWPAAVAAALEPGPTATVVETVDGDTVVLDDGSEVRLVGLQAPKLPLGRRNFPTWPLAAESRALLAEMVDGRRVQLRFGGARMDRHGRHLAHLFLDEGAVGEGAAGEDSAWVQGAMLRAGMARVYSFADNRARVPEMLALEAEARAAGRGIWALRFYAVRPHDRLDRDIGTFQLIEGRVLNASVVRGRGFLNFGEGWRTDFTITLPPDTVRLFRREGLDVRDYADRTVRVRGWLRTRDGPQVEVTHPEQIEVLDP
ncbi:MAG: thermonuclease family protein, partial [Alphaproteobacteria bacterium]